MRQAMFSDDIAAQRGSAAAARPPGQGRHAARAARRRRRWCATSRCSSALYVGTLVLAARVAALAAASSSSGSGCSSRSSPASSCCRPRSASSRPATSSCRSATGSVIRVGLTSQGLRAAGLIVMRVATSISLVVLLTLTTPWTRLLAALRALLRAAHVRARARDGLPLRVPPARLGHRHVRGPQGPHRSASTPTSTTRSGVRGGHGRRAVRQGARPVGGGVPWRWCRAATPASRGPCSAFARHAPFDVAWSPAVVVIVVVARWESTVPSAAEPRCLVVDGRRRTAYLDRFPALDDVSLTVGARREGRAARRQRLRQVDAAEGARRARVPRLRHRSARSAQPVTEDALEDEQFNRGLPLAGRLRLPELRRAGVLADGPRGDRLRPAQHGPGRRRGRRRGSTTRWRCSTSPTSPTGRRTSCPAGRRSGWRSPRCS